MLLKTAVSRESLLYSELVAQICFLFLKPVQMRGENVSFSEVQDEVFNRG